MNNLKDFYPQKKKGTTQQSQDQSQKNTADISEKQVVPTNAKNKTKNQKSNDVDNLELLLEEFDADYRFGPFVGITRLQRWKNAERLGLDPPRDIPRWIEETGNTKGFLDKLLI